MSNNPSNPFADLTFEDFKKLASDESLSIHEKIGFPNSYRSGKEASIFADLLSKLPPLALENSLILDIGPGCGALAHLIIKSADRLAQKLVLVDSTEMLKQLPDDEFIVKVEACYPECDTLFEKFSGEFDCIICYSVFHYIFVEGNPWRFLDRSLGLLKSGGYMLIGDIPNISKRRRFFNSDQGIKFHQNFSGDDSTPELEYNRINYDVVDDSVLISLCLRAREAGYDCYLVPQHSELPMANRREDILIYKP